MLLAEHSGGYGFGYGFGAARTLVQGTDFNCNSSICYGIGAANHALFQQLQTTLNTYAKMGITAYRGQLTVDGFLGDQSLSAARAAAAAALVSGPSTKPQLAANAAILNDQLQAFINGSQPSQSPSAAAVATSNIPTSPTTTAAVPLPSVVKTPSAPSIPGVTPTPMPAMPNPALTPIAPATAKTPLWVWITAGAVGVVVVGTVGYALLREPEAKPALARRRRRR